jgi:hypothetical protein
MTDTEPTIDYVELTARLELPDHEQSAVLAWANVSQGHLWTEAEADRLVEIWAADTGYMRQHDLNAIEAG